ncbi:MAG: hypothetical protein RLZZ436_996 [Planctomycetota bacterium]
MVKREKRAQYSEQAGFSGVVSVWGLVGVGGQLPEPRAVEAFLACRHSDGLVGSAERAIGESNLSTGFDNLVGRHDLAGHVFSQPLHGPAAFALAGVVAWLELGSEGVVSVHANGIGFPGDSAIVDTIGEAIRVFAEVEFGRQRKASLWIMPPSVVENGTGECQWECVGNLQRVAAAFARGLPPNGIGFL